MYFKILNEKENHNGFQYKTGINTDTNELTHNKCSAGGLYFSDENNICKFLDYGIFIREVRLKKSEEIFHEDKKSKARTIQLMKKRKLSELSTWKWMIENNVDITAYINHAIRWASRYGHLQVVKYLVSQGADITEIDNYAVCVASKNGHLEVVKYLVSQGADITADDNYAVCWASRNGHLEVVKYLVSQGADVTTRNSFAVQWASENGHLEVVKYLQNILDTQVLRRDL